MRSIATRIKPILINWLSLYINEFNDPNRQKTPATISNIKIKADDLSYKIMEDPVHGNSYLYLISEIGL